MVTAKFTLGSYRIRLETCWYDNDDDTPAYNEVKQGHSAKPDVNPELCKNMIEVLHGWMNVICHSRSQQLLDNTSIKRTDFEELARKKKAGKHAISQRRTL